MWNGRSVLLLRSTSVPCCNPHYRHDLDRTVDAIKAATIIGTARLLVILYRSGYNGADRPRFEEVGRHIFQ